MYTQGCNAALHALGLIKQAYGPEDAAKVLKATKQYVLPKASNRVMRPFSYLPNQAVGAAGLNTNLRRGYENAVNSIGNVIKKSPKNEPFLKETLKMYAPDHPATTQFASLTNNFKRPAIIPGESDPSKYMKNMIASRGLDEAPDTVFTPSQHKMLHSIIRGHEMDEATAIPTMALRGMGHLSPEVMLREHNRVTTLPADYQPVKDLLQAARQPAETPLMKNYGIAYGSSERLSRHARKRITALMNKDMEDTTADLLNKM